MFDITGEHIVRLNDTDLRRLVALLSEAELRLLGLPLSAVTAGGDQNAADGGLDVRVDLPATTNITGFIPRSVAGFQVKVPDMPRGKILEEMRPDGTLRSVIQELISETGAYIIVSANSSTADTALKNRRAAMRDAVSDVPNFEGLALDFYDRERIASWVRDHPGMVAWVREKIGQPIQGWRPYATWATPDETLETEYLVDGTSRIHDWQSPKEGPLPIEEGINRIRNVLTRPKGVVRLVGLSGLGKTRLVQALFDERIGESSLSPSLAVYTDHGDPPVPSPSDLLRHFIQNRQRAIIIVDNCTPETHQTLSKICIEADSRTSLITIEYDVRDDDLPENTEVFRLEPASDEVIEALLKNKIPWISQVNRRRITEFAGGNARIALALASTLRRRESIATFSDHVLFTRLFRQRQSHDDSLMRAAEACSLVYSFEGNESTAPSAELPLLAELAELTFDQIYRCVGELHTRGLVQRRGRWRALLPQALANKLAGQAFERMHPDRIVSAFLDRSSDRLQISFSRRLGYLHDNKAAQGIVRGWISTGGIFSMLAHLTPTRIKMLRNVAPVAPEDVLVAIESTVNGESGNDFLDESNWERGTWISLLKSIAYDANLFKRCALLLVRFLLAESAHRRSNSALDPFKNLFQIYLSGTQSPVELRLEVIDFLFGLGDARSQNCACETLDTLLKTDHFSSSQGFEFGARPRDFGWQPSSKSDIDAWYRVVVTYAKELALSGKSISSSIRTILAKHFRGIWTQTGIADELVSMAQELTERSFWAKGWIAVCETIRLDARAMESELADQLLALEKLLHPDDLFQKARSYIFTDRWSVPGIDFNEYDDAGCSSGSARMRAYTTALEITEQLGREIARKPDILDALLPDLVQGHVGRGDAFGQGLASGTEHLETLWERLVEALNYIPENERDNSVLQGFLSSAADRNPETTAAFLEGAVHNPILSRWFPILQSAIKLDEKGAARIEESIRLGLAPAQFYGDLWRNSDLVTISTLRRLILAIAALPDGYEVAVHILGMLFHNVRGTEKQKDADLIQCGRDLLQCCSFENPGHTVDYHLGELVSACFGSDDAEEATTVVCRQLKVAFSDYRSHANDYKHLIVSLFRMQPMIALDTFLGDALEEDGASLWEYDVDRQNPVEQLSDETLIKWAEEDPKVRFVQLATVIAPFSTHHEGADYEWKPIAFQILHLAPDRKRALAKFSAHLIPWSWSGSRADIIESRRSLLRSLFSNPDPDVVAWSREKDEELRLLAEKERSSDQVWDESFE